MLSQYPLTNSQKMLADAPGSHFCWNSYLGAKVQPQKVCQTEICRLIGNDRQLTTDSGQMTSVRLAMPPSGDSTVGFVGTRPNLQAIRLAII